MNELDSFEDFEVQDALKELDRDEVEPDEFSDEEPMLEESSLWYEVNGLFLFFQSTRRCSTG